MTLIKSVRVQHVRSHNDLTIPLSEGVTSIIGENGSGKTSILEAIYVALTGSSFKSSDKDIVSMSETWYRIDLALDSEERVVQFDSEKTAGRKKFIIGGKTHYRLSPSIKYPIVLFEPDDLRLLSGSPARRRLFLDRLLSQIDPQYALSLRRYERALRQRNTLLKQATTTDDDLFAWNISLSEYGTYIAFKRQEFIDKLDSKLNETYKTIATKADVVTIAYTAPHAYTSSQKLLSELHHSNERDRYLGYTSIGPHRHDVSFSFNNTPAIDTASRGEVRSIVLALKFLEVAAVEEAMGKKPLVLLDDVFSELDGTRQKNLVTEFSSHQIVISSVSAPTIANGSVISLV